MASRIVPIESELDLLQQRHSNLQVVGFSKQEKRAKHSTCRTKSAANHLKHSMADIRCDRQVSNL